LSEDLEAEFPAWRIVLECGLPLSEVDKWDLSEIQKANSLLEMKSDYEAAGSAFGKKQMKDRMKK